MNPRLGSVLVIAKEPVPGRVKTRLTPPFTPDQAAALALAAIGDTLRAAGAVGARRHVLVLDGRAGPWLPSGWTVRAQVGGGLDDRLAAAFATAGRGPAVLVGMDTPQVTAAQIAAFDPDAFDCCLGPAADGGYWAIGFRDPRAAAGVLPGVPMSRPDTGPQQLARLRAAGLRVQILDQLIDVDTAAAAHAVSRAAPETEFARLLADLAAGGGDVAAGGGDVAVGGGDTDAGAPEPIPARQSNLIVPAPSQPRPDAVAR